MTNKEALARALDHEMRMHAIATSRIPGDLSRECSAVDLVECLYEDIERFGENAEADAALVSDLGPPQTGRDWLIP